MNKITVIKDHNYTVITNAILRDTRLSLKAKGLLVTILGLPPTWDFTIKGICTVLKEGRDAVTTAIDELIECGYCSRINERNETGQFLGYDYTFYEQCRSESLVTESPDTDFPDSANPTQLSKQRLSKQSNKETEEIFTFWKEAMSLNGSTLLTDKRKRNIDARLKQGYDIERIKNAIRGCAMSPFHQGQNDSGTKYNDIELICRNGEKVEFFENIALANNSHTQDKPTDAMRDAIESTRQMFYGTN